jgi:hypothetical protein
LIKLLSFKTLCSDNFLVENLIEALSDILDGLHGIDGLENATLVVVREDGCSLAMVGYHSAAKDFCVVIFALNQWLTGEVILATNLGRVELYVVGAT